MSENSIENGLGFLIDSSEEYFRKFCLAQSLGYLQGLKNVMLSVYNSVCDMKDSVVQKTADGEIAETESVSLLEGLFSKLMRIERCVFIVQEVIDIRIKSFH